ncbi:acyl-CoA dehydrogenase family protein [Chitinivorax sp. B]|uniref:acyl-CoA dehydrogenase family protein n=1 Tax=Chitinivorax sp. B TaxID=2502235 RepID=UPI0010F91786|nr:acyl-CoA dehydrogenase family protein [Chitinivorax sp. B]
MERQHFEQEHTIFRDSFKAFLTREVIPFQTQWEHDGMVSREVWRKAGDAGYLVPFADPQYGGAGCRDFRYDQIISEELAYINEAGFMMPLHSTLCAPYIDTFGNEAQKQRWMPSLVSGERILAVAMTEPHAGSDLAGMRTQAIEQDDVWILNGSKTFISNGILADLVIVAAKTDPTNPHSMTLMVVEEGMPGFVRGQRLKKMGMHSQDTAELFFDNVRVPKTNILGVPGQGFYYLMQMLGRERLALACSAIAGAQAAWQTTREYVLERKAFGREIAKFQNTRFKMAEMKTEIDVGQVFVDRCVMDHNTGRLRDDIAAEAKLFTTELLGRVVDQCVQLHGGWGYMMEYPISKMYLNARIQRIFAGTSEIMKEIIGRANGLA